MVHRRNRQVKSKVGSALRVRLSNSILWANRWIHPSNRTNSEVRRHNLLVQAAQALKQAATKRRRFGV